MTIDLIWKITQNQENRCPDLVNQIIIMIMIILIISSNCASRWTDDPNCFLQTARVLSLFCKWVKVRFKICWVLLVELALKMVKLEKRKSAMDKWGNLDKIRKGVSVCVHQCVWLSYHVSFGWTFFRLMISRLFMWFFSSSPSSSFSLSR